ADGGSKRTELSSYRHCGPSGYHIATTYAGDESEPSQRYTRLRETHILNLRETRHMQRKTANDYPQELLNLFDTYVHGVIDRRAFLEGAQKFAIGGMTAMALWESLRPNYALAQQVPKDDGRIRTEVVTVPSPEGNANIKGYLVHPVQKAQQKFP